MLTMSEHFHLAASAGLCNGCPFYDGPSDLSENVCRGIADFGFCVEGILIYSVSHLTGEGENSNDSSSI